MKIRLIESPLALPRYRQIRLPTVAAEFTPYADIEINDENVEPVDRSDTDLVGFTAQAYNASRAIYLSKEFRSRGIKTMVGGPYASAMRERALADFDAVVVGEVEGLGEQISRDFENGSLRGVYRNEKPPKNWGERLPRRDLQKSGKYYWINYPMEFTRGCPHRCSFCFGPYLHPTFRKRSLDSIAAEIEQWDHGIIEAVDLHFAADRNFIIEVCKLMAQMGVGAWYGEATLRSMDDDEVLKHMELSRCVQVFVGMESIEKNVLEGANKGFNKIEDYKRIIRKIQDHGIFVHVGVMWGLDGQTPQSFDLTADFLEDAGIYVASPNLATYFPGTKAFEHLKEEGRILSEDPRDFDSCRVVVEPRGMSTEDVYAGARRFVKKFYSYRSIFIRSFQPGNYRLQHLIDYWGFNLIYRSYLKKWGRLLGKRKTPWPGTPEEKESYPYVGWRMPIIYNITNFEGGLFHYGYKAWHTIPGPAPRIITALITLAVTAASAFSYYDIHTRAPGHWPVTWPPVWLVMIVFVCASFLSAKLVSLIARMRHADARYPGKITRPEAPSMFTYTAAQDNKSGHSKTQIPESSVSEGKADKAGRDFPHTGNILMNGLLFALMILAASPMIACILVLPGHAKTWIFIASFSILVFLLKSWSIISSKRFEFKNLLRIGAFIYYFPTLDFDRAFEIDPVRRNLIRHYPLMFSGLGKMAASFPVFIVSFYLTVRQMDFIGMDLLGIVGRTLFFYLFFCGLMEFLTSYWRMAGYRIAEPFGEKAFGFGLPSEVWKSWNVPYCDWLRDYIYLPLGGRNRVFLSTLATFGVNGIFLALMLWPVLGQFPYTVVLFFLVNSVPVVLDKTLFKSRKATGVQTGILYILLVLIFLATAPLFFSITDRILM